MDEVYNKQISGSFNGKLNPKKKKKTHSDN
jgi:hypothetical protein